MTQQEAIARIIRQGLAEWQTKSIAGKTAPRSNIPELRAGLTYRQRATQEAEVYNKLQRMRAWSGDLDNAFVNNPLLALGEAKAAGVGGRPVQMPIPQQPMQRRGREPETWHRAAPPVFGPQLSIFNVLPDVEGPAGSFIGDAHMGSVLAKGNVQKIGLQPSRLIPGSRRISPMGEFERPTNVPERRLDFLLNNALSRGRREAFNSPETVPMSLLRALVALGTKVPANMSDVRGRYPTMFPESPMSPLQELLLKAGIKGPMYPQSPPWQYSPPGSPSDVYTTPNTVKVWRASDLARMGLKPKIAFLAKEGTIIRHPITNEIIQMGPFQRWHRISGFGLLEGE